MPSSSSFFANSIGPQQFVPQPLSAKVLKEIRTQQEEMDEVEQKCVN